MSATKTTARPPTCPYCGADAAFVTGEAIYPHRPDLADRRFWQCKPCDAYVGTHRNSDGEPLGRLANADLRRAKRCAHAAFDPLWHAKMRRDRVPKGVARGAAYQWLADQLGIPASECHIGMFDVETCKRVVEICRAVRKRDPGRTARQ